MLRWLSVLMVGMMSIAACAQRERAFDVGWHFLKADAAGAEAPEFVEQGWKEVTLPHDWAAEGPFLETNRTGGAGAFAPYGVSWYRKSFALPAKDAGKRVFVRFDGVMANSDVWMNGVKLGHRPNGSVSFEYELTPQMHFGAKNVLAVRTDTSEQPASRWYEGAGIYRHVRLMVMSPVHVAQWGTFVTAPKVTARAATVRVQSEVVNQSAATAKVMLRIALQDDAGRVVTTVTTAAQTIAAGARASFDTDAQVWQPRLWEIGHGVLYRAVVTVVANGKSVDKDVTSFGIYAAHFEAATGFWLNGRRVKIKGVALHGDVGSLGIAAPIGAWEHRLLAMRAMGANAVRTAHNPPDPGFLDLCDRMGFLVMDEMFDQWTVAKNPYDYHLYFKEWNLVDTRDTVRRDRNHPSVVIWSAGNEIHDTPKAELAKSILGPLVEEFHRNDPTRPVTQALFRPNVSHDYEDGLADMLDVVGQNYREQEILAAHAQKPSRKILGTENTHERGQWVAMRDHAAYAGQFVWSGTDYLGESRRWPLIGSAQGLYDRTDRAKVDGLERASWWAETPVVHMARRVAATQKAPTDPGYEQEQYRPAKVVFADWSPKDRGAHDENVEVYSNCAVVDLVLNGRTLGVKPRNEDDSPRVWSVPFEAGSLKAVGRDAAGAACAQEELKTAGAAAKVMLVTERAPRTVDWEDVGYVRATVVDASGVPVPDATLPLTFSVEGPARIVTTDSGDNADHTGFQSNVRKAYEGTAIAILRRSGAGRVVVRVRAEGLASGTVELGRVRE